jgi:hypothetical protein
MAVSRLAGVAQPIPAFFRTELLQKATYQADEPINAGDSRILKFLGILRFCELSESNRSNALV